MTTQMCVNLHTALHRFLHVHKFTHVYHIQSVPADSTCRSHPSWSVLEHRPVIPPCGAQPTPTSPRFLQQHDLHQKRWHSSYSKFVIILHVECTNESRSIESKHHIKNRFSSIDRHCFVNDHKRSIF